MPSNDNNGRPGVQEKPAVLTSSSSDDGNNSSGDSDETDQDAVMRAEETAGGKQPKEFAAYKDYSHVLPDPQEASLNTQEAATKEPTFPVKLHLILSNPEFEVRARQAMTPGGGDGGLSHASFFVSGYHLLFAAREKLENLAAKGIRRPCDTSLLSSRTILFIRSSR